MIAVTRMNGCPSMLNSDLIETVEARPDTIITLTTGNKIMVKESVEEIVARVKEYRKEIAVLSNEQQARIEEEKS